MNNKTLENALRPILQDLWKVYESKAQSLKLRRAILQLESLYEMSKMEETELVRRNGQYSPEMEALIQKTYAEFSADLAAGRMQFDFSEVKSIDEVAEAIQKALKEGETKNGN